VSEALKCSSLSAYVTDGTRLAASIMYDTKPRCKVYSNSFYTSASNVQNWSRQLPEQTLYPSQLIILTGNQAGLNFFMQ